MKLIMRLTVCDSDDTDNIATDEISFDKHLEGDYDGNDDKRNDENGNDNMSLSLCDKTTERQIYQNNLLPNAKMKMKMKLPT